MSNLNAYFGIEEYVFDDPSFSAKRLEAYFGVEEYTGGVIVTSVPNGYAYAYEWTTTPPSTVQNGYAYAYEWTTTPPVTVRNGYAYAYENSITQANPAKMWVYESTGWVQKQWYIWNGTTWQAVT